MTFTHSNARRRTLLLGGLAGGAALVSAALPGAGSRAAAQGLQKVSIIYPTISQATWPFWPRATLPCRPVLSARTGKKDVNTKAAV